MKLIKGFSLYTIVGFFGAAVNFLMMPVLSHHLVPADYGLISMFNTYVLILAPLMSLMSQSLLTISFFKEKDRETFHSKFVSIQTVPVIVFVIFCIANYFFYYRVNSLLELTSTSIRWGFVLLTITLLGIYVDQYFNFLILQKKPVQFSIFTIAKSVFEMSVTVFFVIYKGMGWEGRILSWLLTSLLFFFIALIYFKDQGYLKGAIKWSYMLEGVLFGLPLIVHTIGKFVVNQSDRIFIAKMASLAEAGIYNIGYTFGFLIVIFSNAFFNIFSPFVLEKLTNMTNVKALQIVKLSYLYIFSIIGVLLGTTLISPIFFKYLIDQRYANAQKYVFWVGLGYVFYSFYGLFASYIMYYNKNKFLGWLAVFNIASNLLLNYFFIKWFGTIGAAYATALSFFFLFILIAIKGNQLVPLPWFKFRMLVKVPLS